VPALNWVVVNYSWHHAFGVLGVFGLLWVVAWFALGKEGPFDGKAELAAAADTTRIPYSQLLTCRTFVGACLATFGAYWALSLGLTWFTPFIVSGLGFSQQQAGWISILPWIFGAVDVLLSGWISQVLMMRGMSTRYSRGVLGAVPLIVGGLILLLIPYTESAGGRVALLVVGTGLTGSIYVVCAPMLGEFTPVSQRGAMLAIYGAIYTSSGIVAPFVMGSMVQRAATPLEGYISGFVINAVILIVAGLLGLLLLRPESEKARLARTAVSPKFA
jgi:MFS family permease